MSGRSIKLLRKLSRLRLGFSAPVTKSQKRKWNRAPGLYRAEVRRAVNAGRKIIFEDPR